MMNIRTTKPSSADKYFVRKINGGFSTCVQGTPTDAECDTLANCVGYANGAFNEECDLGFEKYHLNCNAENFIERAIAAGLSVVKKPISGGLMVWQKGTTLKSNDGAGHVCICTDIIDENTIKTAESSYGSKAFFTATRSNSNGNWGAGNLYTYRGCIVPINYVEPVIEPTQPVEPEPQPVIPFEGVSDEELATRVWTGEFGTGKSRKNALGSRYDAVQALVSQGIGKPVEPEPVEIKPSIINVGDTVIVNGVGASASDGSGYKTREFNNTSMKVIGISDKTDRTHLYALNQYNRGNVGDWSAVTGWFTRDSLTK